TTLTQLAGEVGAACGKNVCTSVQMDAAPGLPADKLDLLRELAIQLVRNAVVHGVEAPSARAAAGKAPEGQVAVKLTREDSGQWELSVRDDGAGLNAAHVRRRLLELHWYSAEQLQSFSDKQIVAHIFKPGFSTATGTTAHAGRGVGLDLVQANVQKLGARLLLASAPGKHTEFRIIFS
ncbi:MAG: ATP-binding protein, partial [Pseudomonadota bacterium]|nr:ATP-binding protein [Pseudomonadota bacterium]